MMDGLDYDLTGTHAMDGWMGCERKRGAGAESLAPG